ncbi:MAG: response regulator [Leptolyngbyaceae bacterium]|nr:response regulator [Leptolyngbyaceae bacterium]
MGDRTVNILLVEDDEVDVMNVRRAFRKMDITNPLYVAKNGLDALELLRGSDGKKAAIPSDRRIILLDLNMPKMNGIEFLEELRADPSLRSIPVIVLTTSDEAQDRMDAYRFHVAGYILKPVTFTNFVEMMATLNRYWSLCEIM